jgi:hypothetical protein
VHAQKAILVELMRDATVTVPEVTDAELISTVDDR